MRNNEHCCMLALKKMNAREPPWKKCMITSGSKYNKFVTNTQKNELYIVLISPYKPLSFTPFPKKKMQGYTRTLRFPDTHHARRYAGFRNLDDLPVMIKILKVYRPCLVLSCETCARMGRRTIVPREVCLLTKCASLQGVETMVDAFRDTCGKWVLITEKQSPTDELRFQWLNNRFSTSLALEVFRRLVRVVCDLRDLGLVHGDLNCGNVLWKKRGGSRREGTEEGREREGEGGGQIVLVNFGFAHVVTDEMIKYRGSDPERYRPPEVHSMGGECHWEPRTVWELGHVLYEMLHGARVCRSWLLGSNGPLPLRSELPHSAKSVLLSCLEKDVQKRVNLAQLSEL